MTSGSQTSEPPLRGGLRWYQISLRSFLILVTLLAALLTLGLWLRRGYLQGRAVERIMSGNGWITVTRPGEKSWLSDWLGRNALEHVSGAGFKGSSPGLYPLLHDLPELDSLAFKDVDLSEALRVVQDFPQVDFLDFEGRYDSGLATLPSCPMLRSLMLREIDDDALRKIEFPAGIHSLYLWNAKSGAATLAECPLPASLKLLGVRSIPLGKEGLLSISRIRGLESLHISECSLGGIDLLPLAELKELTSLDLLETALADSDLDNLELPQSLTTLGVSPPVTERALARLAARSPGCKVYRVVDSHDGHNPRWNRIEPTKDGTE